MHWKRFIAPAACLGLMGVSRGLVAAEEMPSAAEVRALMQRLEAAESEIAVLKGQLSVQGSQRSLYSPAQLNSEIAPISASVTAQDDLGKRVADLEKKWKSQEDAEAKKKAEFPTYKFRGRIDADSVFSDQSSSNMATVGDAEDGADFRRARIGVEGLLMDNVAYVFEMDFSGSGRPSFTDVFATITDLPTIGNVRIGHYKEPFSIEELTSARFTTFLERGLPNVFVPSRNIGVSMFNNNECETMTWATGLFKTASDEFGDDVGDEGEYSWTSRITFNPYYDEGSGGRYLVHVGGAFSYRDDDEGAFTFASTPEVRMRTSGTGIGGSGEGSFPSFVTTGAIPAHDAQLYGLEAAAVWGSFSVQSEYIATVVDQSAGSNATLEGAYVYATYFLTGEHRVYNRKTGAFDRVKPHENFFSVCTEDNGICTGWGAWELKARYSWLDLNDSGVAGGELEDLTLGVNWYLNPNFKLMFDYIHADLDRGADGGDADIFAMRAHVDW